MKAILASAAVLALLSAPAFAQSNSTSSSSSPSTSSSAEQGAAQQTATAKKIKTDLENAGFQDVNVAAQSFMVQAKTKDGDPVVMTIGPHGMTMLEAVKPNSGGAASSSTSK